MTIFLIDHGSPSASRIARGSMMQKTMRIVQIEKISVITC
jgi:hypothetical protein